MLPAFLSNEYVKATFNLLAVAALIMCIFNLFYNVPDANNYGTLYDPSHVTSPDERTNKYFNDSRTQGIGHFFFVDRAGDITQTQIKKKSPDDYDIDMFYFDFLTNEVLFTSPKDAGAVFCVADPIEPLKCFKWRDHRVTPFASRIMLAKV